MVNVVLRQVHVKLALVTDFNGVLQVITIVDINDFAPAFPEPWSEINPYITINVPEGLPNGSVVYKFVATDADSNIESYEIKPKNPYFFVEPGE